MKPTTVADKISESDKGKAKAVEPAAAAGVYRHKDVSLPSPLGSPSGDRVMGTMWTAYQDQENAVHFAGACLGSGRAV